MNFFGKIKSIFHIKCFLLVKYGKRVNINFKDMTLTQN